MVQLKKKHKVLIGVGSALLAIILVLSILMGVAVAKSKEDRTVASGTLSMLGNLIRNKNKVQYETFANEGLYENEGKYPVENFRVSMSAMNHSGELGAMMPTLSWGLRPRLFNAMERWMELSRRNSRE